MNSPSGEYMEWIWEIPIRPGSAALATWLPAHVKTQRGAGLSSKDILARQCRTFPRLREIVDRAGVA